TLQRHHRHWRSLVEPWQRDLAVIEAEVAEINVHCASLFPPWDDPLWNDWQPRASGVFPTGATGPTLMRLGSFRGRTHTVLGVPAWAPHRPPPGPLELTFPARCPFPELSSLLLHAQDEGRDQAVKVLQTILLRLLPGLPPGRVRFTLIDPVGLGQNFAAF